MSIETLEKSLQSHIADYKDHLTEHSEYHKKEDEHREKVNVALAEIRQATFEGRLYAKEAKENSREAKENSKETNGKVAQAIRDIAKHETRLTVAEGALGEIMEKKKSWADGWRGVLFLVIGVVITPLVTAITTGMVAKSKTAEVDALKQQVDVLTVQLNQLELVE